MVDFPALDPPIKGIYIFFPFAIYFLILFILELNIDVNEFLSFLSSFIYNFISYIIFSNFLRYSSILFVLLFLILDLLSLDVGV